MVILAVYSSYYPTPGVCCSKRGPSPSQDEGRLNLSNVDEYVDRSSSYVLEFFQVFTTTGRRIPTLRLVRSFHLVSADLQIEGLGETVAQG